MGGAVDFSECPKWQKPNPRRYKCKCGACAKCEFPKHSSVHGPAYGEPPGSQPWHHEYEPVTKSTTPGGA